MRYPRKCATARGKRGRNEEGKNGLTWASTSKWSVDHADLGFSVGGFRVTCVLEGERVKDILAAMSVNWMVKKSI